MKKVFQTIWLYSTIGMVYILLVAELHPETLSLPLTHINIFPLNIREDVFGIVSSFVSFITYYIKEKLR